MAASSSQGWDNCKTPGDLIIYTLADLKGSDFERFKDKLSDFSYGDKPPIPRGKLEHADWITTKNLLIDRYGVEGVLDSVIYEVLTLIGLQGPTDDFQRRKAKIAKLETIMTRDRLTECKKKYMESMKEDYQRVKEHNARRGETVCLQKTYIELKLITGPQSMEENMHEILNSGIIHLQIWKKKLHEYSPTTIKTLFDPDEDGFIPKIVVLQGPAGIGKTMTSKKVMLDWASGNLYKDEFDFVFHLSCRELNTITGPISLVGLLSRTCKLQLSSDVLVSILKDPDNHRKILFIIDGFDELRWTLENDSQVSHDISEETHEDLPVLLQRLLRKQILKQSSLIITSRPLALEKLYSFVDKSRHVEVLGFSKEDCGKYFHNFFKNGDDADKALSIIKDNEILYTMCAVPIMCWIVCTVLNLKPQIKQDLDLLQYKTATSIYLLYLKGLIKYHCRDQPTNTFLKKLCALAKERILNQKILFEMEDLNRHGLSLSEVESVFLNENLFHQDIDTQTCYSFSHLSVQEFLAALYYVLDDGSGNKDGITGLRKGTSIPEICKGNSLSSMCEEHPHLALAVRFLFGLLNEKDVKPFFKSIGINISLPDRQAMEEWLMGECLLKNSLSGNTWSTYSTEAISCLYETQDKGAIRKILSQSSHLKLEGAEKGVLLSGEDCSKQMCYCLTSCESFQALSFSRLSLDPKHLKTLSPLLHGCQQLSFQRVTSQIKKKLDTQRDDFSYKRELLMSIFADKSADLSWLIDLDSKIETLTFNHCDLNVSSWKNIRSFLKTNKRLTNLDISDNNMFGDSEVRILFKELKDCCTVQVLRFSACRLTHSCCDELPSLLITNRSLISLDLSSNRLMDSGIKLLCEGLKDPDCILQELSIESCKLTSLICDDFKTVLITNRSLTRLNLSRNKLEDSGIKLLCEGLRHPDCTLQVLKICQCNFTQFCCDDLRSLLMTNRSLISLDLSSNRLMDSGIELLCEGLREPGCTLQELRIKSCGLTSLICNDLRSVLIANRSLTKLDLSWNFINEFQKDLEIKIICEGLKHADCTLQELKIQYSNLTPLSCADLRSVLIENRSLIKLDLSWNFLEDSEIKCICEGLKHRDCTLQELKFYECRMTSLCCEDLYSALSTNQTLSTLETSFKIDKGISESDRCFEGLRSLGCTVEKRGYHP